MPRIFNPLVFAIARNRRLVLAKRMRRIFPNHRSPGLVERKECIDLLRDAVEPEIRSCQPVGGKVLGFELEQRHGGGGIVRVERFKALTNLFDLFPGKREQGRHPVRRAMPPAVAGS